MRYSSSGAAAIGAAFLLLLLHGGGQRELSAVKVAHAAILQEPPLEESEREQVFRWDTIALRHADAITISASLGGTIGPTQLQQKDIERGLDLEDFVGHGVPLASLVPDSIQAVIALPGMNQLLVRGTAEDIGKLRETVAYFDYPLPSYRVTLWSDVQTWSTTVLERETAAFRDETPGRRLQVDLSARATEAGSIVVRLSGTAGSGPRESYFSSLATIKPGIKTRAVEFDSPNGRTSLYLRVEAAD